MSSQTVPNFPSASLDARRQAVQARLHAVRRLLRWQLIVEGLAWAVGIAVALTTISLAADLVFRPERPVRVLLLLLGFAALSVVALRRLYRPATLSLNDLDLAELLEQRQRGIGQRLANVLLLPKLL